MLLEKGRKILFETCGLDPAKPVIAAISGGADSAVMLNMLVKLEMNICVAHLNHQLRPTANRDADFVRKLAEKYGLECVSGEMDVKGRAQESGEGTEEAARNARYQFLFKIAEEKNAAAVLTAHQADDQVETILQNILRGSGLNGLTGMQPCSFSAYHAEIPLVRPLLDCWREEILEYCSQEKLDYVTDETNSDTKYRRNRIRLELIPDLQTYNPQIKQALLRMGKIVQTDKDFIDGYLEDVIGSAAVTIGENIAEIDVGAFGQYPLAVQRILVKRVLELCFPDEEDLGFLQVEDARRFLTREITSTGLQLNGHVVLRLEEGRGVFLAAEASELPAPDWPSLDKPMHFKPVAGQVELGLGWKMDLELQPLEVIGDRYLKNADPYQVYLDVDSLEGELQIRTWQAGDTFRPLGMAGKNIKLSDFWTNKKVPARAKKNWPLVYNGQDLIWIPGFQPSEKSKITAKTRNVLSINVYRQ
jgi:tRNA(Ile)-lysidine synthase